ncbi:helix-turn-helix domain-containing protein [Rhizobium sp. GCM10022189]|uniref:helix-turn-helix domain-containing protein n=1 Tax=Rhizobium sp. GCM10022189 TaxID=3252654 RepID=UPI0036085A71
MVQSIDLEELEQTKADNGSHVRDKVKCVESCKTLRAGLCDWQAKRVVRYIDTRLHSQIRVADLAATVRMSPGHFSRAFSISFGITPHVFVMKARINRAQNLMRASDSDMSEVAAACGLADQAHFTRLFRRFVGTTPSSWRIKKAAVMS